MKLNFPPFNKFIKESTTKENQEQYAYSEIVELKVGDNEITAKVLDSAVYNVKIKFNEIKVTESICSCINPNYRACSHIVKILVNTDRYFHDKLYENSLFPNIFKVEKPSAKKYMNKKPPIKVIKEGNAFRLPEQHINLLTDEIINEISMVSKTGNANLGSARVKKNFIEINLAENYSSPHQKVILQQFENELHLSCSCNNITNKLCRHIYLLLKMSKYDAAFKMLFDEKKWYNTLRDKLKEKGLFSIKDEELDDLFTIKIYYGRLFFEPKINFFSFNDRAKQYFKNQLLPKFEFPKIEKTLFKEIVVVQEREYLSELTFTLMKAPLSKKGEMKSPFSYIDLYQKTEVTKNPEELQFYAALMSFEDEKKPHTQYVTIFKNPLNLPFYYVSDNGYKATPKNIELLNIHLDLVEADINVKESNNFYSLKCSVYIEGKKISVSNIKLIGSFILYKKNLYLIKDNVIKNTLNFFKKEKNNIFIHNSQFPEFKAEFLDKLENSISIKYDFVKKAPQKIIQQKSSDKITKHLIYLSESDDYILITPAIAYGDKEVSLLSNRAIYIENPDGSMYYAERDKQNELRFLRVLQNQHPSFAEYPNTEFFYLHKQEFLEEHWFLEAFEEWKNNGYEIFGFKDIKNNFYNPNKIKVSTSVSSGIDWFDINLNITFGEQKVGLKDIQKSIVNKKKYVNLGDGTKGLLLQEWIDKFGHYFRSGEIKNDAVRTHKSNFQLIDELFNKETLTEDVWSEISNYKEKAAKFHSISDIKIPKKLNASLRDYQKEGLNWLNFLDEFGFGGCLADDMGLGKTIQVIAYFLVQHEKGNKDTNLVIVPTSLLFNWQKELDKFAPHLKYKSLYGNNRSIEHLEKYDVVLTTYGTLLYDIANLKNQCFNIIVLDESQAIKNPNSKRYKAARLLQGRQRLVLTGTPVENNTFDLYSQLSFVMPGFLGSIKRFKEDYFTPIDKYQDEKRAKELQKKVHPFILRRTKKQVAKELPEKTEMVIYCEMGKEQRKVYDTFKSEFQSYLKNTSDEELKSSSLHILQGLTKLRQICNSPALLSDQEYYGEESTKLEELMIHISALIGEHKILIFSQFVGMLELIKAKLDNEKIKYAYLTGKTINREKQVELFQNNDEIRVFLISLKAGGMGLNLTKAEYVFIVDPWWNPAVENQAIDRAYRIGQKNNVTATRLIALNSIEEKIMALQERKLELVENLIHTESNIFKKLSKDDLLQLV